MCTLLAGILASGQIPCNIKPGRKRDESRPSQQSPKQPTIVPGRAYGSGGLRFPVPDGRLRRAAVIVLQWHAFQSEPQLALIIIQWQCGFERRLTVLHAVHALQFQRGRFRRPIHAGWTKRFAKRRLGLTERGLTEWVLGRIVRGRQRRPGNRWFVWRCLGLSRWRPGGEPGWRDRRVREFRSHWLNRCQFRWRCSRRFRGWCRWRSAGRFFWRRECSGLRSRRRCPQHHRHAQRGRWFTVRQHAHAQS